MHLFGGAVIINFWRQNYHVDNPEIESSFHDYCVIIALFQHDYLCQELCDVSTTLGVLTENFYLAMTDWSSDEL